MFQYHKERHYVRNCSKYKEKEKKKASTIGNAIVAKENFDTTNVLLVTINTRMMGGSLI